MNLVFRLTLLLIRGVLRPGPFHPLATAMLNLRVLPNDLDLNLHMNNGRFLTIMDLGRIDLMQRMGLMRLAFRGRWLPALGGATIRYYRPLKLFQRYQLYSRVVCWDEKWFYLEQRFEREGKPVATAMVKGLVRSAVRSIPSAEVLAAIGFTLASPPASPEVAALAE